MKVTVALRACGSRDGRVIETDLLVVAVGVRPNVELARTAGIEVNRGIVVDDGSANQSSPTFTPLANAPSIAASATAWSSRRMNRRACWRSASPDANARYPGSVLATNLKVSGVKVFSAGDFLGAAGTEAIVLSDPGLKTYKKLVIANDRLVGAVLFGDTADGPWYLDLIRAGASIGDVRNDLVFGRAVVELMAA